MAEIPNLAGIATNNLVDKIGTGRFEASYINWARTINLLHEHAPGWMVNYVTAENGGLVHKAPGEGGYLLIGFEHLDGTSTPPLPQAVMNHRNNSIPYEEISARDITDTQRRGMCMAAAMTFGLAYELWAKMPLESGYSQPETDAAPAPAPKSTGTTMKTSSTSQATVEAAKASEANEEVFRAAAQKIGVNSAVIDILVQKLGGKFEQGLSTLAKTSGDELNKKYGNQATEQAPAKSQW
jgi:hypothetical protein